jgi:hypothetical protein
MSLAVRTKSLKAWTRLDWFILILFAVLVALFYWRILIPNLADRQSFPPGDFSAQFWAFATFEVRELSAGRLPLWNPYTFAGAPFWADVQSAVFYPPSLLTLLLSAPWGFSLFALEVEAIAHFWLAATFMYLFIREVIQNRTAAVIAALIFTFSGYLTGYPSQQLAVLEADVWLPLILFFIYRASQKWKSERLEDREDGKEPRSPHPPISPSPIPSLLLAGVAWGMTILAGHPQSYLIIAYISTAYFFFLWLSGKGGAETKKQASHFPFPVFRFIRAFAHWLILIITGLALAAIQFIPAAEYTLLSVRAEGTYSNMSDGFLITDIIQMLLPGQVSFYSPLYVGVVGLILALWVIFARPNRHTTFWAVVAGITFLISFGGHTFLYSPLYLFTPGFSIFRGQERWAFAIAFSLSVLAGYGFQALLAPITNGQQQIANNKNHLLRFTFHVSRLTQYLFFFALLLTFLFFYGLNDTGWTPASPFYNLLGAATLLTLLLALTWLLWKFAGRLPPLIFTTFTAALICFDLFTANWQTNLYPQLPEWHTQMPDIVAAIKKDAAETPDELYRVYNEFRLYDNYGVPFEIEDLWGASPLLLDRYNKFIPTPFSKSLVLPIPLERTWELLNVKYVITWRQELYVPSTIIYQEPTTTDTTYVHRLDEVGPRAWLVTQAEIVDDVTILQKIADPDFDRWRIGLLEPGAEAFVEPISQTTNDEAKFYVSRFTFHSPQSLSVQVNTSSSALLLLSEIHYPGWQATISGQPAPLLRADYVLRAVPVPAGEHMVELKFRPLTFIVGAIISALTLFVIIVGLILFYRRRGSS